MGYIASLYNSGVRALQLTDSWWSPNDQDARAESNEGVDEENQESSPETPDDDVKGPSTEDRPTAVTTSSGESSSDKDPAPTPRKATKRKERTGVPKVPFSRLSSTQGPLTKGENPKQAVQASRIRRL